MSEYPLVALASTRFNGHPGLPVGLNRRAQGVLPLVALPFTFPSLQHFEESVTGVLEAASGAEGLSDRTVARIRFSVRRLCDFLDRTRADRGFLSGQLPVQLQILERWLGWLRAGGANHTTVNHYWRMLHSGLKRLSARTGMVDPTSFLPTPRTGRPLPRFLTRDALTKVLDFVANHQWPGGAFEQRRNVALLACMALGGLRRAEVLRLTVAAVDLRAPSVKVLGKGTGGGKGRLVFLPPGLVRALTAYLDERASRVTASSALFLSTRGDRPIGVITIRRLCETVRQGAGIAVAPHMLRHTCATLLRQFGVADRLSMEQLGHASLGVLQRYSHVTDDERRDGVRRLDLDAPP